MCASSISEDEMKRTVLPCILDVGECLMKSGADVNHVERLVMELGLSFGALNMNVLVITSSIIVTMTLADGREYTQTRRIFGSPEIDFYKLELLNKLCREAEKTNMSPREFKSKFLEINKEKRLRSWHYIGGIVGVMSYTAFFGGGVAEVLVSAIFAAILCFMIEKFAPYTPNTIGFNVFSTAILGILIGATCKIFPNLNEDVLIIGEIMLLIPGLAMTNAIRDMFSGETLSGLLRFVESLLWTAAMVLGFMFALWIFGSTVHTNVSTTPYLTKLITVVPATIAFLLYYNSRIRLMVIELLGAVATYAIYIAVNVSVINDEFIAVFLASMFASIFSEISSKKLHVPSAVFFVTCILPIIPGRFLFTAMNFAVQGFWEQASSVSSLALGYSIAIAIAICLVWTVSRTWRNLQIKKRLSNLVDKRFS